LGGKSCAEAGIIDIAVNAAIAAYLVFMGLSIVSEHRNRICSIDGIQFRRIRRFYRYLHICLLQLHRLQLSCIRVPHSVIMFLSPAQPGKQSGSEASRGCADHGAKSVCQ
jgi:hypothetical protein